MNKQFLMKLAIGTAGILIGNMIAERFVLKMDPGDDSGFIDVKEGFGLDDIARGALGVLSIGLIQQLV